MSEIISINIIDQNLAGLANIEVELWGTNPSDLGGQYQKIHNSTVTTDSSGTASLTTSVDLHPFNREFDCKLYFQSELIKTISGLRLDEMIGRGIFLRLNTISGVNAIVIGVVNQLTTRKPIEGVKVEFWIENGDKLNSSDILTDARGEFRYTLLDPFFLEKYKGESTLIKLYFNDQLEHTETIPVATILEDKYIFELDVSLVDNRTISGQVNNISGNRLNNIKVELFKRVNTTDTLLGSMTTNNSGDYSISYDLDPTAPMGKTNTFFIKATDANTDVELASSTPQPVPLQNYTINITVDLGGTESRSINGNLSNVFNQDLVNYTVKAYAIIGGTETLLGNDLSNTHGDYNILYSFTYNSAVTRYPKVFIKVFNTSTNQLLATSSQVTSTLNKTIDLQVEGIVYTENRIMSGQVSNTSGNRLNNIEVELFKRVNSTNTLLGTTTTSSSGHYSIAYDLDYTTIAEKTQTVFIKATDTVSDELIISTSPQSVSTQNYTINITVDLGGTENRSINGNLSNVFNQDLVNYTAKAYAIIGGTETLLGNDLSNTNGDYNIPYSFTYSSAATRYPKVFIKVFNTSTNQLLATSAQVTSTLNKTINQQVEGIVYTENRKMSGRVTNTSGNRRNNIEIELFKRENNIDISLGNDTTNHWGYYSISYDLDYSTVLEKTQTVFIKATDTVSDELILSTSPQSVSLQNYTVNISVDLGGTESRSINGKLSNVFDQSLANYTVKAFAIIDGSETLLGNDASDTNGDYNISYSLTYGSAATRYPNVFIKVFNTSTNELLATSSQVTSTTNKSIDLQVEGIVYTESRIMSGQVSNTSGNRLNNIEVELFKRVNSTDTLLGTTTTDDSGNYSIGHDLDYTTLLEKTQPVFIKATDTVSDELILSTSPQSVSLQNYTINISVDLGGSEEREVHGKIFDSNNNPCEGYRVNAYSHINSVKSLLGTAIINSYSDYQISYDFTYGSSIEKDLDLSIEVVDPDTGDLIESSQTFTTNTLHHILSLTLTKNIMTTTIRLRIWDRIKDEAVPNIGAQFCSTADDSPFHADPIISDSEGMVTFISENSNFEPENSLLHIKFFDEDELIYKHKHRVTSTLLLDHSLSDFYLDTIELTDELKGKVIEKDTGLPLQNTKIELLYRDYTDGVTSYPLANTSEIFTDSDGCFTYPVNDKYFLVKYPNFYINCYYESEVMDTDGIYTASVLNSEFIIELSKVGDDYILDKRHDQHRTVFGEIENEFNTSLSNYPVEAYLGTSDYTTPIGTCNTDEWGNYIISYIQSYVPTKYRGYTGFLSLRILTPTGELFHTSPGFKASENQEKNLTLPNMQLDETRTIYGKITNQNNYGIGNYTVIPYSSIDGVETPLESTETDVNGNYDIHHTFSYTPGESKEESLVIKLSNQAGDELTSSYIYICNETKIQIDLSYNEPVLIEEREISGTILDEDGEPINNCSISFYSKLNSKEKHIKTVTSEPDGTYSVTYEFEYCLEDKKEDLVYYKLTDLTQKKELFISSDKKITGDTIINHNGNLEQPLSNQRVEGYVYNHLGNTVPKQIIEVHRYDNDWSALEWTSTNSDGYYKKDYYINKKLASSNEIKLQVHAVDKDTNTYIYSSEVVGEKPKTTIIDLNLLNTTQQEDRTVVGMLMNYSTRPFSDFRIKATVIPEPSLSYTNEVDLYDDGSYRIDYDFDLILGGSTTSTAKIELIELSTGKTLSQISESSDTNSIIINLEYKEDDILKEYDIHGKITNEDGDVAIGYEIVGYIIQNNQYEKITTDTKIFTDTNGEYLIPYSITVKKGIQPTHGVFFKLLDNGNIYESDKVSTASQSVEINMTYPPAEKTYTINGHISGGNGHNFDTYKVFAFHKIGNSLYEINDFPTVDSNKNYSIEYTIDYIDLTNTIPEVFIELRNGTETIKQSYPTIPLKNDLTINLELPDILEENIVQGTITDEQQKPIKDLKVAANYPGSLPKSVLTDSNGFYSISYETDGNSKLAAPINGLYIDVFNETNELLKSTKASPITNPKKVEVINLVIEENPNPSKRIIHGQVVDAYFKALNNYPVEAYAVSEGNETLLGQDVSDMNGDYKIDYNTPEGDEQPVNLIVKLKDSQAQELLMTSPLILNSLANEEVNLALSETCISKSSFDIITEKISNTSLAQTRGTVTKNDIIVAANKHKISREEVSTWVAARQLSEDKHVDMKVLYALLKQMPNASMSSMLLQKKSTIIGILNSAVQKGHVDKSVQDNAEEHANNLLELAKEQILENKNSQFNKILGLALDLPENGDNTLPRATTERELFLDKYIFFEGEEDNFWTDVNTIFSDTKTTEIKELLELSNAALNNYSFIEKIKSTNMSDDVLLSNDISDWESFIATSIDIPDSIVGENEEDRKKDYAIYFKNNIEILYPTESFIAKAKKNNFFNADFNLFLNNNPQPNFKEDDFSTALETANLSFVTGGTAQQIEDRKQAIVDDLQTMQRLFKVTPETNKLQSVENLYNNNIHSSLAITRKGKNAFKNLMAKASIDKETSLSIYSKAEALTFKSLMLFSHYQKDIVDAPKQARDQIKGDEGLKTIFGSLDYCGCKHCQSVYGPASYLTDIMHFLENIEVSDANNSVPENFDNLLDCLTKARRQDLKIIDLNCKNTDTLVPFIDLVNEILELAVAPIQGTEDVDDFKYQTNGEQENIKAYPEYLRIEAYDKLLMESFPWSAPFHLWNEEANAYLSHLEIDRSDLLKDVMESNTETVNNELVETITPHSSLDYALEYFNISQTDANPNELDLITNYELTLLQTYNDSLENIQRIEVLLDITGFSFEELENVIQSVYVNSPPSRVQIEFADNNPTALELATLRFDEGDFKKLHQFSRLRSKLNWTVSEMDKTLFTLGYWFYKPIDNKFIINCYEIEKMREETSLSVVETLAWFNKMDTNDRFEEEDSLYNLVYLNKAVENGSANFNLDNAKSRLVNNINLAPTGGNTENRVHVMASLSISQKELDILIDLLGITNPVVPEDPNHPNLLDLTKLYRASVFCKTFNLSIEELQTIIQLIDSPNNSFDIDSIFNSLTDVQNFITEIHRIKASGWSIYDLKYLLSEEGDQRSNLHIDDNDTTLFLEDLRTELKAIRAKYIIPKTTISELVEYAEENTTFISSRNAVPDDFDSTTYESKTSAFEAICYLDPELQNIDNSQEHFEYGNFINNLKSLLELFFNDADIIEDILNIITTLGDPLNSELSRTTFISTYFTVFTNQEEAESILSTTFENRKKELGRIIFMTNELVKELMKDTIYQKFSKVLGLEYSMIKTLFKEYFIESRITSSFNSFFLRYSFITSDEKIERISMFKLQYFYFEAIYKAALFIKHNKLSMIDIEAIHFDLPTTEWLKFTSLPALALTDSTNVNDEYSEYVSYQRWSNLEKAIHLNKSTFNTEISFFEFLNSRLTDGELPEAEWTETLSSITGWNTDDLVYLSSEGVFNDPTEDIRYEEWYFMVKRVLSYASKLKVSAEQLMRINKVNLSTEESTIYRKLVKSTMDSNQWLAIAPKIRKPLREKQRDALSNYLVADNSTTITQKINDVNDIYEQYLIDPEMSSCAMTSRIKQASLSVQLFVQRILMGMELGARIGNDEKEEWQWSKQYRLWEANRKIFVQPENYLEPDLRRDKSELFDQVEKLLKEDDINEETADRIYRTYLTGLTEIANLEICDISANHVVFPYIAGDLGDDKVSRLDPGDKSNAVHVLARTKTSPHNYYYRNLQNNIWTPWEKIEVDISGEQAVIAEYQNQIFVAWLEFVDQGIEEDYKEGDTVKKSMDIRLVWTSKNNNKWSNKKISKEVHNTSADWEQYNKERQFLGAETYMDKSIYGIRPTFTKNDEIEFYIYMDATYVTKTDVATCEIPDPEPSNYEFAIELPCYPVADPQRYISFLCSYKFKSPISDPIYTYRWLSEHKKHNASHDQWRKLNNGIYVVKNSKKIKNTDAFYKTKNIKTHYVNHFCHINLYQFISNSDSKIIYPSSLSSQYMTWYNKDWQTNEEPHIYKDSYYSQDPWIHQDSERSYLIMPQAATTKNRKSIISGIISNDISSETPLIHSRSSSNSQVKKISSSQFFCKSKSSLIIDRNSNLIDLTNNNEYSDIIEQDLLDTESKSPSKSLPNSFTYKFSSLYHPYADLLLKTINTGGIAALFPSDDSSELFLQQEIGTSLFSTELDTDSITGDNENVMAKSPTYWVDNIVDSNYPIEKFSFEANDAYSVYNWEIFFHIPMLIADKLCKNKKFEEAQKWYHYIFDPSHTSLPGNDGNHVDYWKTQPLAEPNNIYLSTYNTGDFNSEPFKGEVENWRNDPFNPHKIAFTRPVAYMKNVIMKYLDNLIAWADHLFKQDSMESINEATQLYIMAANILGRKPVLTRNHQPDAMSYQDLSDTENGLDDFSNAIIQVIDQIWVNGNANNTREVGNDAQQVGYLKDVLIDAYYFGYPNNDKLMSYWDTVADRLFKIRHCMNIKGVERQLALFQPPIDPALIAKALAGGLSLGDALNELNAPLSFYRYKSVYQKALELSNDVKALGQSLLSALEKKDAESLSILRSGHELKLQSAIQQLKELSIEENDAQIKSLEFNKKVVQKRTEYYDKLVENNLIKKEQNHLEHLQKSSNYQERSQASSAIGGVLGAIPTFHMGFSGWGPETKVNWGGMNLLGIATATAGVFGALASTEGNMSNKASITGGHERRTQEWNFQIKTAEREMDQIEKQIIAAEIRKAMAERELFNHEIQMDHSQEQFDFVKDKFTNEELYSWMSGQISDIHFQSYQMAVELAKKAEKSYRFETNDDKNTFISYGNWDGMKKGLLAGEKLQTDLRRMDLAYMEKNKRQLELTKNVSLAMLDPHQLLTLRETGTCYINIPETLFDLDFPGQYMRRIKSVGITIPAVTGPNTNINCNLRLESNRYRKSTSIVNNYVENPVQGDTRFAYNIGNMDSIATSTAQNDNGMFQLNFNDERYLPFEGAGAISVWNLELPSTFRQFDYDTISDVIIHINYTALEEGGLFKTEVQSYIKTGIADLVKDQQDSPLGLQSMISLKSEFANELHQLSIGETTTININNKNFPYFIQDYLINDPENGNDKHIKIKSLKVVIKSDNDLSGIISIEGNPQNITESGNGYYIASFSDTFNVVVPNSISIDPSLITGEFEDIFLVLNYETV